MLLYPGDYVLSIRKNFSRKHRGLLLDPYDQRAWRMHKNNRMARPFPFSDSGGSDLTYGRAIPNKDLIVWQATQLVLLGDLDFSKTMPILWNFGGREKIYWEPTKFLRRIRRI